ncbi:LytR/AlgR family response regulator transcription factor [Dongshaea marina]|uniref:LytR/AlgR family response regulator transcription factor n=1 Tax=Dongshaea marina TaxID=2047966 RepID=UPI000D3EC487|nr:LytTR family DNA-binding domain-containing protein [Dongshaea marina]
MLKAIIVEDEYLAREELSYLVGAHSQIEIKASFEDGLEAFKYLQDHKVDLVFLDINIPSIDGMMLAKTIAKFAEKPLIIFTTAYKEFAVDAFEVDAFDYILKPFNEERICAVLQKIEARQLIRNQPGLPGAPTVTTINLYRDGRILVTEVAEINYAVADEKQTLVFTANGQFSVPMSISELVEQLPAESFFRCHRSYCINLRKIKEITPWVNSTYLLKLYDESREIPVSRSNLKQFRQLLGLK